MASLQREGDVFTLGLGDGENRFNPEWIGDVNNALDEVEAADGPRALAIAAEGKFWSNGLDLDWLAANGDQASDYIASIHDLLARVLGLGVPVVAAIQGHCFAGGAMLALAADERVMRDNRGFFCLPEVDINIPFTPGMSALIQARLVPQAAHEAMTTGRRYGGTDAMAAGIVQQAVPEDEVLPAALARAAELAAKSGGTLATIKRRMYAQVLTALSDRAANGLSGLDG